ncbi:MAG TPA: FecR family protein [Steroidobacteraceae bacterium]|nr:FecR family protein [Steroidobacteraceae bacterium]
MSETKGPEELQDQDRDIAALLRASGPRPRLPDSAAAALRQAVEKEWRASLQSRVERRRRTFLALAASIGIAGIGLWLLHPARAPQNLAIASLTRTTGQVQYREPGRDWQPAVPGTILRTSMELASGSDGRSALELESGVQLRLDADTRLSFDDPRTATLAHGSLYVDTGAAPADSTRAFQVETPHGRVSHLGTQYLARVDDESLRVAVREGGVSISSPRGSFTGMAGEQLMLSSAGLERAPIEPYAEDWRWVGQVMPPYEIEGRSVEEFLAWTARETGRSVRFASAEARELARQTTLRGSIGGLEPEQALDAVLATTSLQPRIETDLIHVNVAE